MTGGGGFIHLLATVRAQPQRNCKHVVLAAAQSVPLSKQLLPLAGGQSVGVIHEHNRAHARSVAGAGCRQQRIRRRDMRGTRMQQQAVEMLHVKAHACSAAAIIRFKMKRNFHAGAASNLRPLVRGQSVGDCAGARACSSWTKNASSPTQP